jgi:hypothetical protein
VDQRLNIKSEAFKLKDEEEKKQHSPLIKYQQIMQKEEKDIGAPGELSQKKVFFNSNMHNKLKDLQN